MVIGGGSREEGSLLPAQMAGSLEPHIRVGERRNKQGRGGRSAEIYLVTCWWGGVCSENFSLWGTMDCLSASF